jgi:hypothetical protein
MAAPILTQERLKELFHYNPDTGILTRVKTICGGVGVGEEPCRALTSYGYKAVTIDYKKYQIHRLAFLYMTGKFPPHQVDHINGVRHDNRWINLRPATDKENSRNMRKTHRNKSGVSGVRWYENCKKWRAQITASGTMYYLGHYNDWFDAVCARKSAERVHNFHPNHGHTLEPRL